jgi:hypothetical protein
MVRYRDESDPLPNRITLAFDPCDVVQFMVQLPREIRALHRAAFRARSVKFDSRGAEYRVHQIRVGFDAVNQGCVPIPMHRGVAW